MFSLFNSFPYFQKEELGRLLINLFAVVPGGVVCFFSSYDYEQQVYKHWQSNGILDKMNARKKVRQAVFSSRSETQEDRLLRLTGLFLSRSSENRGKPINLIKFFRLMLPI